MQVKSDFKSDGNFTEEQNWLLVPYSNALSYGPKESHLETFSPEVNLLNGEKMLVI